MNHLPLKLGLALSFGLTLTLILLLFLTHLAAGVAPAHAAEHTVCQEGPPSCTFTNVQATVDAAIDGDAIKVAAGVYTGVNNYGGLAQVVYISRSLTIRGGYTTTNGFAGPPDPAAHPTTLDAAGQDRVLYITGNISPTIEGLRIIGGDATGLGGEPSGGAAYIITATITISDNEVFDNYARQSSGVLYLQQSN